MTAQYNIVHKAEEIREINKQLRELFNRPLSPALLAAVSEELERSTGIILTQSDVMLLLDPYPYVKAKLLHQDYDIGTSGFFDVLALELLGEPWPLQRTGDISDRDYIDTIQLAANKAGYIVINKSLVMEYEKMLVTPGDRLKYFDYFLTDPGLNARYHWLKACVSKGEANVSISISLS